MSRTSQAVVVALVLRGATDVLRRQPVPETDAERKVVMQAIDTTTYEMDGLADRIRAAQEQKPERRVNGTPVTHPVKPYRPPTKPAEKPKDPPPEEEDGLVASLKVWQLMVSTANHVFMNLPRTVRDEIEARTSGARWEWVRLVPALAGLSNQARHELEGMLNEAIQRLEAQPAYGPSHVRGGSTAVRRAPGRVGAAGARRRGSEGPALRVVPSADG